MHAPIFHSKAEARAWGLRLRAAIPAARRAVISADITERVTGSPLFAHVDTLLTYVGSKAGELDTRPLIEAALAAGKTVLVPLSGPNGMMQWSRLRRISDLAMTSRGILEPGADATQLEEPAGGLCVTPGICFRLGGHRIGFGAGCYDRFLHAFSGTAIALSPEALYGVDFPVEAHDQPVAAVFTEAAVHAAKPLTFE